MPGADYTRPASRDATGLVVTVLAENGEGQRVFDFSRLTGALTLRRELAAAFDARCGPGGTWRSARTAHGGYYAARTFLSYLDDLDHAPQALKDLTPAAWSSWRMSLPANNTSAELLGRMRQLLLTSPAISTEMNRALSRRIRSREAPTVMSYSLEEFAAIRKAAALRFNVALRRIRGSLEHLRRWQAGEFAEGGQDDLIGTALDSLMRTGDVPLVNTSSGHRSVRLPYARALGGSRSEHTWERLFLTPPECLALAVLLVASEGWNRAVLHTMTMPAHDPAAGEELDIHRVELRKPRRPARQRYTTNNLVDTGPGSPGRLMSQAIEATAPARHALAALGQPTDRLLVSRHRTPHERLFCLGIPALDISAKRGGQHALLHDGDTPVPVSLQRLRRTVQVRIRRQPGQNSVHTHESTYLLPDPAMRESARATVEKGLAKAVEHARVVTTLKMVTGAEADVLTELADHPALAKAVLSGELDTATAACTDFHHSPHSEPGRPCTASFLLCLACPNAIATRRHLPRLVYLHRALQDLRATLEPRIWELDWREHHDRLEELLLTHTTIAEQEAVLNEISMRDRRLVEDFLRRRFDS
ncbi:hypothetical protein [Amycolatopsis magusensis]|uniref:hypothetical protein n=1 Tax=Amycolatopsis magusensis TaxID=882444 RepID=UPI0037A1F3EB